MFRDIFINEINLPKLLETPLEDDPLCPFSLQHAIASWIKGNGREVNYVYQRGQFPQDYPICL